MYRYLLGAALLLIGCAPSISGQPGGITPPGATSRAIVHQVAEYKMPYYPTNIAFDSRGGAWLNCGGTVVEVPASGEPQTRFGLKSGLMATLYITAGDQFWQTVSGGGVDKLSPTGEILKSYPGPSSDWAPQPFTVDGEGNVWVGYNFGSKTYKYSPDSTRLLDLSISGIRGLVLDSKGNIVAGGSNVVTWLAPDGKILRQQKLGDNILCFGLDADDNVWALDQDDKGSIYRLRPDDTVEIFTAIARRKSVLLVSPKYGLWFTADHTLYRMDASGAIVGSFDLGEGYSSLALDPTGYVWAGYQRKEGDNDIGVAKKLAID